MTKPISALSLMGMNRAPRRRARRNFKGALNNGLTFDWATSSTSSDSELRRNLRTLRFRSRDLERNNDHVRSWLRKTETQVVGADGIRLQMNVQDSDGSPDQVANDQIERAWREWSRLGSCTMDGRQSFADVQRMVIRTIARDGEILVREVRGRQARNRFGYAIQLIEADHLDEDHVTVLPGDRRVKMGVEVDHWNRPIGYHVFTVHPGDEFLAAQRHERERVQSRDMFHPFMTERPGQSRGYPWIVSAMLRLQMLGGYEEAELVASRVSAGKMGFFSSETGDDYNADGEDEEGNLILESEPGRFEQLPNGFKFEQWDPQHPTTAFKDFQKAMLRGVAASVDMSYNTLSGDLESVNFSSLRQGALNERDGWRAIQMWLVQNFHGRVFESWLEMSLTSGAVNLPITKFEKFNNPIWQPRGWQWVDPLKEANANISALESGIKTRSEILAERGRSFEDFLDEMKREEEIAKAKGVTMPTPRLPSLQEGMLEDGEETEDEND